MHAMRYIFTTESFSILWIESFKAFTRLSSLCEKKTMMNSYKKCTWKIRENQKKSMVFFFIIEAWD